MRRLAQWVVFVSLLALAGSLAAQRVEGSRARANGPYEAEVPVRSQTVADRNNGFARALVEVLGKLSGNRNVAGMPGMGQELRNASTYVSGYDFRQDEGVSASTGAPTFQTVLVVRFDPAKVSRLAGEMGVPVWPTPRPRPVLWLAIDDGRGPRLVALPQAEAARAVLDRARERGYSLGLPAGNAAEQVAAAAIWRGDVAAVARLSARYVPPMQLIGKLYRSGANWRADWQFVDNGRVLASWSNTQGDARLAMRGGADGAADALVRKYARRSGPGPGAAGTYRITFVGIRDADAYMRLSAALQRMSIVRAITPVTAGPDRIVLDLDMSVGLAGFARAVDRAVLSPQAAATSVSDPTAEEGAPAGTGAPSGTVYRVN